MQSFSFNPPEINGNMYYEIWTEIQKNKGYFWACNPHDAEEAMSRTLLHALRHYDPLRGELKFYILKLARTIMHKKDEHEVMIEYIETVVTHSGKAVITDKAETGSVKGTSFDKDKGDMSEDVINKIYMETAAFDRIAALALNYPEQFLLMVEAIVAQDGSSAKFSNIFKRQCLDVKKDCVDFGKVCIDIYQQYSKALQNFVVWGKEDRRDWAEADYDFLKKRMSPRTYLYDQFDIPIVDADTQEYTIQGNLKDTVIVMVDYQEILQEICEEAKKEISPFSLRIGKSIVYRTLGESVCVIGSTLEDFQDIQKMEIITNIVSTLNGKILNIGSRCIYLLCKRTNKMEMPIMELKGILLQFCVEILFTED